VFADNTGTLVVSGALHATGAHFTSPMPGTLWGGIIAAPAATVELYDCTLEHGGTFDDYTGATLLAHGALCIVSNCMFLDVTRHGCIFEGGHVRLYNNRAATSAGKAGFWLRGGSPLILSAYGNTNLGAGLPSLYLHGSFWHDVTFADVQDKLFCHAVTVSNASMLVPAGLRVGFGYVNSYMAFSYGSLLMAPGTPSNRIVFTDYLENQLAANQWAGLRFLQSTGLLDYVTTYRASRHMVDQGVLVMTNTILTGSSGAALIVSNSVVTASGCEFSRCAGSAVQVLANSESMFRNCIFRSNNPPYAAAVFLDESSAADARLCWWNSPAGPYPFGPLGNEMVTTNGNSFFFPWLLAAPGSLTNPPLVNITSPTNEPYVTSDAQVWLEGMVHDDGQVVSVVVQNAASQHRVQVTPGGDGSWRGHMWLYQGLNALAVYAYDEHGNVAMDARLVQCNGAGVGQGSARPLTMAPMPNRTVHVGELVRVRCVATSPDSCILTYWAQNVPPGGVFDQELRELTFIPTQAGVAHVIEFYACDGKNVAKTSMTIDVVGGTPPVGIRTKSLPGGYRYYPYTYTLIPDNAVGPVTWSFSNVKPQDGITISRAGIISGVPLKNGTVNFIAIAQDTRGGATASNAFTLTISQGVPPNGIYIPFQQVPVCVSGASYAALATLSATNGVPAYAWYDAWDVLSDIGMTISSNGVIAGTPTQPGVHGWLPVVRDQSNATAHAELALPVIAPEHRLQRMAGQSKAKLLINRVPGSETKGSVSLKMRFTPPAGFTFDQKSPVVAQIGLTQITVLNPFKYKPGAQLVFKKKDGIKSYSITVKYKPGTLQASFSMKKVNLTLDFEQYGIRNENVLTPVTANIPVWVRIGNYEMATELMPLTYTTKAMKSTKGTATF